MAEWMDLMQAKLRRLCIGGRLVLGSGLEIALTGDMVSSLTVEEGVDGALMPGDVLSGSCTLDLVNDAAQWLEGGSILGGQQLIGATLMPEIGVQNGESMQWQPLGVYQIESAVVLEGQGILRVKACDSIAFELAEAFEDGGVYPATLAEIWRRIVGQTRYAWSGDVPNGSGVVDADPGWSGISLRTAMGMAAAAAGCFVRVNRSGGLELRRIWQGNSGARQIGPDCYFKLERDSASFGPVDALNLTPEGEDAEEITFHCSGNQNGVYAFTISGNPLFQKDGEHMAALAQGTADLLAGYGGTSMRFDWRGDPTLAVGDVVVVADTAGNRTQAVLTRQTMKFGRGFSAGCTCAVPEADSGVRRVITPEGGLNADALVGAVDGGLIRAGSITTNKLAADSITAEKLAAGAVDAGSISAITAKLKDIAAGRLTTDQLYAAFADVAVLSAGSADFDFATVQHLVARALNLEQGVGDTVFIKNLSVDFAQMVSAQIGSLVIKASDGGYYALDVDADGNITATPADVSDGEISAGTTSSGKVILETNITASNLSTSNLLATFALINEIDAARIDVDELFAREAFISKLTTSLIIGGKSLTMVAGEAAQAQESADFATPIDSEEPPETAPAAGRLWIDRGTTPPIFRRWKGLDASTDREWSETSSAKEYTFDNTDGRLESLESMVTAFAPKLTGSGMPSPDAPLTLTGIYYLNMKHNGAEVGKLDFGQILYGVEADWLGGTWKQTHGEYSLTGTENVSRVMVQGDYRFNIVPHGELRGSYDVFSTICTHFVGAGDPYGYNDTDNAVCVAPDGCVYIRCDAYPTVDAFKAWLAGQYAAGTPVRVVYKLKGPVVNSFAPVALHMTRGNNLMFTGRLPAEAPEPLMDTVYICSGWETVNSAEDIRMAQAEIQLQQQNAQASIDELRTAVVTDNEGVHVRKVDNDNVQLIQNELLITQKDLNMVVNGKKSSTYGDGYIRLLSMVIRVASNGIVIEAAEV